MTARTAPPASPEYVRISAAPQRWPISRATFYRAIQRGDLRKYKPGSIAMLRIAEVEDWIANACQQGVGA